MAVEQAYLPFDYLLWAVLVTVTGYFTVKIYKTVENLPEDLGGAVGDSVRYIQVGTVFIFIHTLYELLVIHYNQAWFVAKFLSITPQVFGLTLLFFGIFRYFRAIDVI